MLLFERGMGRHTKSGVLLADEKHGQVCSQPVKQYAVGRNREIEAGKAIRHTG